ncbi:MULTISPECIES: STAS domain-containing protein [Kocuria]|uniref:STAS domain-containing protein n=1 Tax=Kocuria TaxID=57493 RepID=UPI00203F41BB|nr:MULTISPECIES: STAS domain-containing protein [Kocuria]MCM3687982.1 STAS domain-containing protein [Kocuria rosea]HST72382.1 STAS domain-containing protein [Kocuria rosea]
MQFTVEQKPTFAHITGTGRLNMVGAPRLREVVADVVADGSTHVVVDLGGTEFMDSSGLGALIGCLKLARQAGGDLRIANVSPQVRMVLELTSMHRVLTPYASADEAFAGD